MTEATGGRRYYNCQWAQEDVETLYNLLNNNNFIMRSGARLPQMFLYEQAL
jgi:hypothetical protein